MITFNIPFNLSEVIDMGDVGSGVWVESELNLIRIDSALPGNSGKIEFEISDSPFSSEVSGKLSLSFEENPEGTLLTSNLSLHFIEGMSVRIDQLSSSGQIKELTDEEDHEIEVIKDVWRKIPERVRLSLEKLETNLMNAGLDAIEGLIWSTLETYEYSFKLERGSQCEFETTNFSLKWAHHNNLTTTGSFESFSKPNGYWDFTLKVDAESAWGIPSLKKTLTSEFEFDSEECDSWLYFLSKQCDLRLSVHQNSLPGFTLKSRPEIKSDSRESELLMRFLLKSLFKNEGQILRDIAADFELDLPHEH